MLIYNLFPLLAGPFANWTPHLKRARSMGFDWIFTNPIQHVGYSGSLYAVSDYFEFNPLLLDKQSRLKPEDQVREMIKTAQSFGLKIMIDLVINHCAFDSKLVKEHPEWFAREENGDIAHPFCIENGQRVVWGDLVRFDHRGTKDPEGLYRYCLRVIEYLISLGVEGFRCDAAYQIPQPVWQRLIREVKSRHPAIVFVAETLGCTADQTKETAQAGFDFVFNSSKWWNYNDNWLLEQYNLVRESAPSIAFPESHDTARLFEESRGNLDEMKQRYLFTALFSAGVMIPSGFEFGFRKRLHVVETRPTDWEKTDTDLCAFIAHVNQVKKGCRIFREECPTAFLACNNPNVLVMWKASTKGRDEALLILNKDVHGSQDIHADALRTFVQSGAPMTDVSPEYAMDYIPEPFHYALRPGQGIVLATSRK